MDKEEIKKAIGDLIGNRKWIESLETKIEAQIGSARSSLDKNIQKAIKGLNITTKKDLAALNQRLKAVEKRLDKLEEGRKARSRASKAKSPEMSEPKETD
ncbi:MAG: phasin family protein [Deltaproteobacteria bacterium]